MTLLAAFKALLARYTGEEDIVVGTPVASRSHVELESIVGFFANTLVLRTDFAGDPTFRELLGRVREVSLGAYAHQDMPFEKLVEELRPDRKLGENPLFRVSFVFQSAVTGPGFNFMTVASPFDLTMFVRGGNEGPVSATIEYRRDLFKPETVTRLAGHYRALLDSVTADPDRRLSTMSLLDHAETRRLLVDWNATSADYPLDRSIPGLFEDQVASTPDAVAAVFEGMSLTYRDLNRNVNRLAHHLGRYGVGPNVLVGIYLDRSLEMLVAVLAVLKAGGAYVPLDPAYPADRLEFMIQDAELPLVVTRAALLRRISIGAGVRALHRPRGECNRRRTRGRSGCPRGGGPRLCDLHVGVDRETQGGADRTSLADQRRPPPSARLSSSGLRTSSSRSPPCRSTSRRSSSSCRSSPERG